jgi:hypothetical protein
MAMSFYTSKQGKLGLLSWMFERHWKSGKDARGIFGQKKTEYPRASRSLQRPRVSPTAS